MKESTRRLVSSCCYLARQVIDWEHYRFEYPRDINVEKRLDARIQEKAMKARTVLHEIENLVVQVRETGKWSPFLEAIDRIKMDSTERAIFYLYTGVRFLPDGNSFCLSKFLDLLAGEDYGFLAGLVDGYYRKLRLIEKGIIVSVNASPFQETGNYGLSKKEFNLLFRDSREERLEDALCVEEDGAAPWRNRRQADDKSGGGVAAKPATEKVTGPADILNFLDRWVVGQHEAKEVLSTAAFLHYRGVKNSGRQAARMPNNVLLLGPTGVGKTYLVRTLAGFLGLPVVVFQSGDLTATGYVGRCIGDIVAQLYEAAGNDARKAEAGIVFLDEIDKLALNRETGIKQQRDVSGRSVQEELLSLLESLPGTRIFTHGHYLHSKVRLDISRVLFIAAGSFEGLDKLVAARQSRGNEIGFIGSPRSGNRSAPSAGWGRVSTEDLVNYGMLPELVGRFSHTVSLPPLSQQNLVRLLRETEGSPLLACRQQFKDTWGVDLVFKEDTLARVADLALARKTGARGLASVLGEVLRPYHFQLAREPKPASGKVVVKIPETLRGDA